MPAKTGDTEMVAAKAYGYGRQAAYRLNEISCPFKKGSPEWKNFWDGVKDVRGEDFLNLDTEWD